MEAKLLRAAVEGRTPLVHRLLRNHGSRERNSSSTNGNASDTRGRERSGGHGPHWVEFDADDPRRQRGAYTGIVSAAAITAFDIIYVSALGSVIFCFCMS